MALCGETELSAGSRIRLYPSIYIEADNTLYNSAEEPSYNNHNQASSIMISGIAHINMTVPVDTLDQAEAFYAKTLGMTRVPVPALQRGTLAWYIISLSNTTSLPEHTHRPRFDITPNGQQVHISFGPPTPHSSRHPCFKIESPEALLKLQNRIWEHYSSDEHGAAAGRPLEADEPGKADSGAKGVEYPRRFFARDYAGNRLEFSL